MKKLLLLLMALLITAVFTSFQTVTAAPPPIGKAARTPTLTKTKRSKKSGKVKANRLNVWRVTPPITTPPQVNMRPKG